MSVFSVLTLFVIPSETKNLKAVQDARQAQGDITGGFVSGIVILNAVKNLSCHHAKYIKHLDFFIKPVVYYICQIKLILALCDQLFCLSAKMYCLFKLDCVKH